MRRLLPMAVLLLAVWAPRAGGRATGFSMPFFPLPKLARDEFGQARRIGFLSFLRELHSGGVRRTEEVDFLDNDYGVIENDSLPLLAAWLESTCRSVGFRLNEARRGSYDGTVAARLLEIGASLAAARGPDSGLAMPIGIVICTRRNEWGALPADGGRDAYALIVTDQGLMIYDPPTRQLVGLSQFPNSAEILNIQF